MMIEIDQQMHDLSNKGPDLIVVPVGVGSLAHAVVAHYKQKEQNCTILAVEPENAACLKTSLEEGQITTVTTADTSMCGMNCGTVSFTAWPRLCRGIDACITVTDDETEDAQAILGKQEINVGPCAAATMAALQKACKHHKDQLHLNEDSVVVLLATEGPR
jgi:diaminopropionate ammonia-lyase